MTQSLVRRPGPHDASRPRILLYSHDTYGLGHLRRSTRVADAIRQESPRSSVLIVSGAPKADAFRLPPGVDLVKLPSVTKTSDGGYSARRLDMELSHMVALRAGIVESAVSGFRPDVVLVDHSPLGMGGELRRTFELVAASARPPTFVLGLRDIIDDAEATADHWTRAGVWSALQAVYNCVLVYGDERVLTTANELELSRRISGEVTHVGYVADAPLRVARQIPGAEPPLVLVTAGGGGDGWPILSAYAEYLEALSESPAHRTVVVTGPFLSPHRFDAIKRRLEAPGHPVVVERFTRNMEDLVSLAVGVVGMAGYNSVAELLNHGTPALLVPRRQPRREQWIRAERLSRVADVAYTASTRLSGADVARFVTSVLERPRKMRPMLDLDGAGRAAREVVRLAAARHEALANVQ